MGLIDQAQADIEEITSNLDEFGVSMTLTAPSGEVLATTGLHAKIHMGVTTDGNMVNSKKAHVSFSEKPLTDASYPVRNGNGEIDLKGHKVSVKDSSGGAKNYLIMEWFPDETIGLIICILEDYDG